MKNILILLLVSISICNIKAQCWERSFTPFVPDPSSFLGPVSQLRNICFIDDSIGWVAGLDWIPYDAAVCKTVDGGKTWKKLDVGKYAKDFEPYGLAFSDRDTGWLVGQQHYILYTINGGDTWDKLVDFSKLGIINHGFANIFLQNGRTAWCFDNYESLLYNTYDFGKTWNVKKMGFTGESLHINSKGVGWADNYFPLVYDKVGLNKTTDSAATFQHVLNVIGGTSKISFHGDYGVVFNSIGTKILTTNDYGNNWDSIRLGPDSLYFKREKFYTGVDKIDSNEIILCGYNRYNFIDTIHLEPFLLKSYNNGKTWRKQKLSNTYPHRLVQTKYIHKNFAVAIGDHNQVYIYRRPPAPICDLKILSNDTLKTNELLTWSPASGCIGGYYLSIGTTPNKKDILDSVDIEDVLHYDISKLQPNQDLYFTLIPYNDGGVASSCSYKKLYLKQCTLTTRIDTMINSGVAIEGIVYNMDTIVTKTYKSQQGCDSIVNIYIDVLTSNEELSFEFIQPILVSPNPTIGNLQVSFQLKKASFGNLYITDNLGRTLWKCENYDWNTSPQLINLDVSKYPSGVYQLHWQSKNSKNVVSWVKVD